MSSLYMPTPAPCPSRRSFSTPSVSLDSFSYYGTDDLYLNALARFLKIGGTLGIAGAGLTREMDGAVPDHLRTWWTPDLWCLHSAAWWRRHWDRTGIVATQVADTLPDGWQLWLDWHQVIAPHNQPELEALKADAGQYLGYIRVIAHRQPDVTLSDPIESVPTQYVRTPLLRNEG